MQLRSRVMRGIAHANGSHGIASRRNTNGQITRTAQSVWNGNLSKFSPSQIVSWIATGVVFVGLAGVTLKHAWGMLFLIVADLVFIILAYRARN